MTKVWDDFRYLVCHKTLIVEFNFSRFVGLQSYTNPISHCEGSACGQFTARSSLERSSQTSSVFPATFRTRITSDCATKKRAYASSNTASSISYFNAVSIKITRYSSANLSTELLLRQWFPSECSMLESKLHNQYLLLIILSHYLIRFQTP